MIFNKNILIEFDIRNFDWSHKIGNQIKKWECQNAKSQ